MGIKELTDEELMSRYQNGEELAFQIFYERFSARIFGFVRSKVRNVEKANDIFQEIFMRLHKSKHLYTKSLPVLPWIFTVTRNVITDELRKTKHEKLHVDIEKTQLSEEPKPETVSLDFRPALLNLSENQKVAIEMRYFQDKTFEEIAASLKTSPLNVRQLVSRGIKSLKAILEEEQNHDK